jgi:hypothetical protein
VAQSDGGCDRLSDNEEQGMGVDHMGWNWPVVRTAKVAGPRRPWVQGRRGKGKASIIALDLTLNVFYRKSNDD